MRLAWLRKATNLCKDQFPCKEAFRVALRGAAFHPSQSGQPHKHFFVEPMFRSLGPKMCHKEASLALQDLRRQWHVQVRLIQIAVPFGNLIFEDQVIAECVPSMPGDLAMILVRIVAAMRENEVRIYLVLEVLEPPFNLAALRGKEAILELNHLDAGACSAAQKVAR